MRLILTICLLCSAFGAFAQGAITITSSDMPKAGEIIATASAATTGSKIDLTLTDTNYVWDFSNLSITSVGLDTIFDTKLLSSYPKIPLVYSFTGFGGATYAEKLSNGVKISTYSINNVYEMHAVSSKASTDWGFAGTVSGVLPIPFKNTPLDTVYRFPLNYLNADSSFSLRNDSLTSLIGYYHRQMRHNMVDGWGKLITPYGDTFKVLRVKSTIVAFDSITIHSGSFKFGIPIPNTTYEYKWLSNSCHIPVMQINATGAGSKPVPSTITMKRHVYGVGVKDITKTDNSLTLYPNPAGNNLKVVTDNSARLEIYNINGKLMWQGNVLDKQADINTAGWPAGQYLAKFAMNGTMQSRTFIVTR